MMTRVLPRQATVLLAGWLLVAGLIGSAGAAPRQAKAKPAGPVVSVQTQKMTKVSSKHLAKARALREKGKNDLAIAEYRQALTIDPSSAEAALELGGLYYELDIFPQCAEILEAGLPMAESQGYDDQTLGEAYCQLARSQVANGASDQANAALLKAAKLIPNDPRPHMILGELQAARERFDDAFQSFRRALKIDPQLTEAWSAMGELALQTRRAKEASEALQGLQQADSLKAKAFREAMAAARLEVVAVAPPPRAAPPVADPYADDQGPTPTTPKAPQPIPTASPAGPPATPAPATVAKPGSPSPTPAPTTAAPTARPTPPTTPASVPTTDEDPDAGIPPGTNVGEREEGEDRDETDDTGDTGHIGGGDDPYGDQTGTTGQPGTSALTQAGPRTPPAAAAPPRGVADQPRPAPTPGPRIASTGSGTKPLQAPSPAPRRPADAPPGTRSEGVPGRQGGPSAGAPSAAPAAPAAPTPTASAPAKVPQASIDEAMARFLSEDGPTAAQGQTDLLALGAPVVPLLAEKLADPDPNLRRRTLRVLGEFGPTAKPAFSAVEEALADPDPGVVEAAQDALDRIGAD